MQKKQKIESTENSEEEEPEVIRNLVLAYSILFSGFIAFTSLLFTAKVPIPIWFKFLWYIGYGVGILGVFQIIYVLSNQLKSKITKVSIIISITTIAIIPLIFILIVTPFAATLALHFSCPSYLIYGINELKVGIENSGDVDGVYIQNLVGNNVTFRKSDELLNNFTSNINKQFISPSSNQVRFISYQMNVTDENGALFIISNYCSTANCIFTTTNSYSCIYDKSIYFRQLSLISQNPL